MSDQAAAVPTVAQTAGQTGAGAAPTQETDIEKKAVVIRRKAFLAAYGILRPAGEIDSRAQAVLVSALVLIALCVVPEKPKAIDFGGVSFSLKNWLWIAIPLCVIVIYATVELYTAWKIQWECVDMVFEETVGSILGLLYKEMGSILMEGDAFHAQKAVIDVKRQEIKDWYDRQSDEIRAKYRALEDEERFENEHYGDIRRELNALSKERDDRELAAGIPAFNAKVDQLFKTGFDQNDELIKENNEAVAKLGRLLQRKKTRLKLGLVVPLAISGFSLVTFAWAIFKIVRAHHG